MTGTKFQFVPYRGSAPMNQDLAAGHIDFTLGMAAATYPLVRSGQIKAYAMMTRARWRGAPDVPTMEEAGVPGLLRHVLARAVGAEGHAQGHRHEAQWRAA